MCASDLQGLNAGLIGSIHIVNFICTCIIIFTIDLNKILSLSLSLSLSLISRQSLNDSDTDSQVIPTLRPTTAGAQ